MKRKKRSINVPIADLARDAMRLDDLCPDVGMGMSYCAAIDNVLERFSLKREDVDYDGILDELCGK